MYSRTRSSFPLILSLCVAGVGCSAAPPSSGDGSTSAGTSGGRATETPTSADASGTEPGGSSTTGSTTAPETGAAGSSSDGTTGEPGLGPSAKCVTLQGLPFDDLIDGVSTGVVLADSTPHEISDVEFTELDDTPAIAAVVGANLLLVPLDKSAEAPAGTVLWIEGETFFEGESNGIRLDDARGTITIDPVLVHSRSGEETRTLSSCFGLGFGTSRFELDDTSAFLDGTLGSVTFAQVQAIRDEHPEIDTLVLRQVPGSVNDEVNVETGRMVRDAGWNTFVPADGEIASGGVDLFCAGVERRLDLGARLGVHSWSDGVMDGADYPSDDPAHEAQLAYFTHMLGEPGGPDFYWFTLAAAPADDIHWMTDDEIEAHQLLTP